jgi:hypothetical protein
MMPDYKVVLTVIAVAIGLASYIHYGWNVFQGKIKPHAFSWLVWGVLDMTIFPIQLLENAGPGAWVTGITGITTFIIFGLALAKGDRKFVFFDWASLAGAAFAMVLWAITKQPLYSVILVTIIDFLGFLPTWRKGYYKPHEEGLLPFWVGALKFGISIFALESFTVTTWLYPVSLVISNGLFVPMVLWRRRQVPNV